MTRLEAQSLRDRMADAAATDDLSAKVALLEEARQAFLSIIYSCPRGCTVSSTCGICAIAVKALADISERNDA